MTLFVLITVSALLCCTNECTFNSDYKNLKECLESFELYQKNMNKINIDYYSDDLHEFINVVCNDIDSMPDENDIQKIKRINDILFLKYQFLFVDMRNDIELTSPVYVLKHQRGSCVGLVLIYLLVCERLKLPVNAIQISGHLYLQYASDTCRFNIEPMKNGASFSDEWYQERFYTGGRQPYSRVLTTSQFAAVLFFNTGNYFFNFGDYHRAELNYHYALKLLSGFDEAKGNLALLCVKRGDVEEAIMLLNSIDKKQQPEASRLLDQLLFKSTANMSRK